MQEHDQKTKKDWTELPMSVRLKLEAWADHLHSLSSVNNFQVLRRMAPSALRGLFLQRGRGRIASMRASHDAYFDFNYPKDNQKMEALYEKAKRMQWNGSLDLKWDTSVDPFNPEIPILGSSKRQFRNNFSKRCNMSKIPFVVFCKKIPLHVEANIPIPLI